MRNRTVRLTENDLNRLVKRILKEQQEIDEFFFEDDEDNPAERALSSGENPRKWATNYPAEKGPYAYNPKSRGWFDADDVGVMEPKNYSEEKEFGPEDYESFMEYINNCNTKWCLTTKRMYDAYAKEGKIKVRK